MDKPETTTETTPEANPSSRGVERESLLGGLRVGWGVKAMIGAAILSTSLWLAGCGNTSAVSGADGANPSENNQEAAADIIEFDPANLGSDADREASLERAALHFAQMTTEYMATEGKITVEKSHPEGFPWLINNYESDLSNLIHGGRPFFDVVMVDLPESVAPNEQATLEFGASYNPEPESLGDETGVNFSLKIKEGKEGQIPLPETAAQLPAFVEWLGSPAAAETFDPDYIEVVPTEDPGSDDIHLTTNIDPTTDISGVFSFPERGEYGPADASKVAGDLNKTQETLIQMLP